nr:reverse transcriptase domain-containing protein [Tanacetum cinerariifolium]
MDDEPMWAADHVVAPTLGSAITIPETANEFSIKGNHLTLVKGNQFGDLELKPLPDNLEYTFLEEPSFLPLIISSQLSKEKKNKFISVLKKHKQAFAWKTTDIPGIFSSFYKQKVQLLDDKKPVVQKQRRLNPDMQEVVKKEIMKLLDTGIIYPIADSPWEGIVLGHKVSSVGLEVDKGKVDVISKLPTSSNIEETQTVLDQCHHGPTGGYYGPNVTAKKVLDSGFYWPTIIKEARTLVRLCEACQKIGNISKRDEMPLNNIQNAQSSNQRQRYSLLQQDNGKDHEKIWN